VPLGGWGKPFQCPDKVRLVRHRLGARPTGALLSIGQRRTRTNLGNATPVCRTSHDRQLPRPRLEQAGPSQQLPAGRSP
jgi:hypothetical protein